MRAVLSAIMPPLCHHCRASCGRDQPLCEPCDAALTGLAPAPGTAGAFRYEAEARTLVAAFKFRGGARLAPWLARRMLGALAPGKFEGAAIVPVPSHPAHVRSRGYSQSRELALALGQAAGRPVADLLTRGATSAVQTGAPRAARLRLAADTFSLVPIEAICGARKSPQFPTNVVVCDDVATTGVTLELCASLLRDVFCGEVRTATFASVVRARHGNK